MAMANSASPTASSGESARTAPSSTSAAIREEVRFQTRSSHPPRRRFRAIGSPMIPRPRNATRVFFMVRLFDLLERDGNLPLLAVPESLDEDAIPHLAAIQDPIEVVHVGDRFPIQAGDDVSHFIVAVGGLAHSP